MSVLPSDGSSDSPKIARIGLLLAIVAAVLAAGGCARNGGERSGLLEPYRTDLPQGNYVTREMLDQVKQGMSREQVRFALGSPLLNPMFRSDRWTYVFRYQHPNGNSERRSVTVFFKDDRVAEIKADELPQRDDPSDPALPGYTPDAARGPLR